MLTPINGIVQLQSERTRRHPTIMNALESRRVNLAIVLRELEWDGVVALEAKAELLGTTTQVLRGVIAGDPMSDELAREIEWATHKPGHWMDDDHFQEGPL